MESSLQRPSVAAMDAILGQRYPVLNDGFVRVMDYMGSDASVVQAARVSYGAGTKHVSEDRTLLRYLLRHRHTTPFEMASIKLHVRVPMDCWRQWIRHRTVSVNEYSTRYSEAIDSAQRTPATGWRQQSATNRQGSGGCIPIEQGEILSEYEQRFHQLARDAYNLRIEAGVAREQARKDLPLSTYTEAYWKINLHNLLHFLGLRADSHAQAEIRLYAETILHNIVANWVPETYQAFLDYRLNSLTLSSIEIQIIAELGRSRYSEATAIAHHAGWLRRDPNGNFKRNRERAETEDKLATLGLRAPWLDVEQA